MSSQTTLSLIIRLLVDAYLGLFEAYFVLFEAILSYLKLILAYFNKFINLNPQNDHCAALHVATL